MYVPGKSNPFFAKHKFHGVRVYGSYQGIEECKAHHYVGSCATVKQGIAVYVLTPEHLWASFQTEAEDLLKADGAFIDDPRERNRREREQIHRSFAQAGVSGAEAATLMQMGTEVGAHKMVRRLGHGNMHLFLDIYPLHRFFMERGWQEFDRYLPNRKNDQYPVYWEVNRNTLPFGEPFREIGDGFKEINAGRLRESVRLLAQHEQVNILQKIMYEERVMQWLLSMNQFAWATGFPTGDYQEIQLSLSAQCKAKAGVTSWFSKDKYAKLWVVTERMKFVLGAAERFDKLLNSPERRRVEESIQSVAEGGGAA